VGGPGPGGPGPRGPGPGGPGPGGPGPRGPGPRGPGPGGPAGSAGPASLTGAVVVPGGPRLARVASELLISAEASANMVVLRTPAGAAQFLASVMDHAAWPSILGTVAGDDTVLVITRDPAGGPASRRSCSPWPSADDDRAGGPRRLTALTY